MATFLQEGRRIDYTPGTAKTAGDVVIVGSFIGVCDQDIAANTLGALGVRGVYSFVKLSGTDFTAGDKVKWDGSKMVAATVDAVHGTVVETTATGVTAVKVDISPAYAEKSS